MLLSPAIPFTDRSPPACYAGVPLSPARHTHRIRRPPARAPITACASGARMLTTLVHELGRRGGGIGVAAMCAGGGQGGAVVIEV